MAQRAPSRVIKDVARMVRPYGWTWTMTKSTHVRFDGPNGEKVFLGSTSHDARAMANILARFRRQGLPL